MGNSWSVELTAAVAAAQEGVSSLFHSGCTVSQMVRPLPLDSVPYVTGSVPIVGLWEILKAVSSLIHTHKP
jgi:hypothetical protein